MKFREFVKNYSKTSACYFLKYIYANFVQSIKFASPQVGNQLGAPIRSIAQYLNQEGRKLIIPPWQREYVWQIGENGEVGDLLNDLKEFIIDEQVSYLIGSVITCQEPKGSGNFWLIDGQQRTLTFLIFLMAAKRYITNEKLKARDNLKHEELSVLYNQCISYSAHDYEPKVSMDRGKADSILQSIYIWSGLAEGEKPNELLEERDGWTSTQKNLASVAEWIYEKQFKNEAWIEKENFLAALSKVLHQVKLIEIELPNPQEALTVFDRINNRGAELNSSDLIKNRIFQNLDDEPFSEVSDEWREMKKNLAGSSITRLREPAYLLRALALIQNGKESIAKPQGESFKARKITYNEVTKFWSNRLDPRLAREHSLDLVKASTLIEELTSTSNWLERLSYEKIPNSKKFHFKDLYFARYLKIVQHFPLLLAGKHLSFEVFEKLVSQVHARTTFYYLSGEKTQDFEKIIPDWTYEIARLDKDSSIKDLEKVYSQFKMTPVQFKLLKEVMNAWSYRDSTDKKKIRSVLAQLSRNLDLVCDKESRNSPESYFDTKHKDGKHGWDIDHIQSHGRAPKDSILHTIGNLTLLHPKDNSSRGKLSPKQKSANYENCPLILTKTLVGVKSSPDKRKVEKYLQTLNLPDCFDLENWDEKEINSRSNFYFVLLEDHLNI